ncbi:uncharacterized protein LOC129273017 [Lytechinus pictus]|uniref:uncharacterized protein LOC129273017 n=1 Tax=Lytechinus pictus TaxID=7653 RepID=UPI0030B9C484
MDPLHRMVLQKNWTYLLDSLKSDDVIPYLIQELVLDFDMVEEIEAAETNKQKTRRLMTKLMRRGPTAYQAFRESLQQYDVYDHLVQRLDSTRIDPALLPEPSPKTSQSEQPDIGITQMEEDTPSQPSTLCSQSFQPQPVQQSPHQLPQPPQQLPQPPHQSPLPMTTGNSNFRIAGNNNFVIMGSNNTQVYYH